MKAQRTVGKTVNSRLRSLLGFIGVLLAFIGAFASPAGAQTVTVSSVAQLQAALAAAAAGTGPMDIRMAPGTYNVASPLFLDAPAGTTLTLQNAGDGAVTLHSASGGDILRTGWGSKGSFVVRGLTFSGTTDQNAAINNAATSIKVADCTFVDNDIGFYMDFTFGTVEFVNDTFTQNGARCAPSNFCGAIWLDCHASATVRNSTVAGNPGFGVHGLYAQCSNSPGVLANSIIHGNFRDCHQFPPTQTVASIDSDSSCGATTVDPQLAAPADNGGLVQTMALPTGSPAGQAADPGRCPLTDARTAFRRGFFIPGAACDIGAFERSRGFQAESATGLGPVGFETSAGTFINFHAVAESSLPQAGKPQGVSFPFGFFEWTIIDLTPGETVTVNITFPSPVPTPPQYWKVDASGVWMDVCLQLPCVVDSAFPNVLQLTITDGGVGDLDVSQNGMIRDPGGLGAPASPPLPSLSISDVSVAEGDSGTTNATFTVTLSGASTQMVSVDFATADGSAMSGDDYVANFGTLTFNPGQPSQTLQTIDVAVTVNGDTLHEPSETFFVNLSNPTNATISKAQGVGTISNDDPPPSLSINDVSVTEGNSGTTVAVFTVTLSPESGQTVTVDFATADGTAAAGSDYVAQSKQLTFQSGQTMPISIIININGDTLAELDETFFVNLSNPTNAVIAKGEGGGTILNDDPGLSGIPGPQFQVNTFTLGNQFGAAVGMNLAGNFVIAWVSQSQDGDGNGVFAQRFDASGTAQGPEFRVNTFTAGNQGEAGVAAAMDATGNFVVVWDGAGSDDISGIFAQRFDANGTVQGGEFQANTTITFNQAQPAVAMDAVGNFVVAWISDQDHAFRFDVFAQRFDAGGTAQGPELRVNTLTENQQRNPGVGMDAAGNFVVVWDGEGSRDRIFAQRFDAQGAPQGSQFQVDTTTANVRHPALGMGATGDFVIAWAGGETVTSPTFSIFARSFDTTGTPQGNEFQVNVALLDSFRPAARMDAATNFVVAWEGGFDGSLGGVFARRFTGVGNTPAGNNVFVQPVDTATGGTPVTLTFSEVLQAGQTTLTTSTTGPAPPAGFQLGDPPVYFELRTTAELSSPVIIRVCINYAGINFTGSPQLFHFENNAWVNILPVDLDTVNQVICGNTTSLSPFALFAPSATFGIRLLYDPTKSKQSGSTFPIKIQIIDAGGNNRSSSQIVVTAVRAVRVSDDSSAPLEDSGNANPDFNFRFDSTLGGSGGYIFNLSANGFASEETYRLFFTVAGDPVEHSVPFQVK